MRVLFISKYFPSDVRTLVHGVFKRMAMFIDAIKEIAELDMLFYVRDDLDVSPSAVSEIERSLSNHWKAEINLFLSPRFTNGKESSKWVRYASGSLNFFSQALYGFMTGPQQVQAFEACLRRKPDAIFAHKLESMGPLLLTRQIVPRVFLDLDDIQHIALMPEIIRPSNWRYKAVSLLHLPALLLGERRAINLAHRTFVCSELDRRYLKTRLNLPGVVTVPNAIAIPELQPITPKLTLLFIGAFLYRPNIDAAEFLIEKVWPDVVRACPAAHLVIAGNACDRIRGYETGVRGVEFTGFVDDLDRLYRQSKVVCAPILMGAGTRVKIVEAAAYGKPIVATRIGAEGLKMRDGCELLLRDDPESFAEACVRLLQDQTLCERLGAAAHATAVQFYDRAKAVRLIQRYLKNEDGDTEPLDMT